MGAPKLGVTLYSFNAEYYSYRYSFEECMAAVGSLGPGQGVELVGPQMIRAYPDLSAEFEARFKRALERYDLRPAAYGGYADAQRITGRWPTREEEVEYLKLQIRSAARLGFPVIRLLPTEAVLTDLVPFAERHGVKMGMEIHAPMTIESLAPVVERVQSTDSPFLGFIPDCGAFCHSCASVYVDRFREQGVDPKIIDHVLRRWKEQAPVELVHKEIDEMGADDLAHLMATESEIYFGHGDPASLNEIMPYIIHVHGKFFGIDKSGADSAVRFPELISVLVAGGYDGYISCEYEGHHWHPESSALEQLKLAQSYIRRQLA